MKQHRKTRAQMGETLLETLVSILVISLSSVVLLTSISASTKINNKVREMDARYQTELKAAEQGMGTLEGTIQVKRKDGVAYSYEVLFAGAPGEIRSYEKKVVTPP